MIRPTHRAEYESTQDLQLVEAPTNCTCLGCEAAPQMGTADCRLRRSYRATWTPHGELIAELLEREEVDMPAGARVKLGEVECVSRWGREFVDAVIADLEHRHWHLIYQSSDEFGSLPDEFPAEYEARPSLCYLDSSDYWPERVTWRKPPMRSPVTRPAAAWRRQ